MHVACTCTPALLSDTYPTLPYPLKYIQTPPSESDTPHSGSTTQSYLGVAQILNTRVRRLHLRPSSMIFH